MTQWTDSQPTNIESEPVPFDAGTLFLAACVFLLVSEVIVGVGFLIHVLFGR